MNVDLPSALVGALVALAAAPLFSQPVSQSVLEPDRPLAFGVLTPEQAEILGHMSIVHLDDGVGGVAKTVRISDVNVQVVNGLGSTETSNGLGNVIVGYNELGSLLWTDDRTGSHNVAVGVRNSYESYGSLVVGVENRSAGPYCSVTGGERNQALGSRSTIGGGMDNSTNSNHGWLGGGSSNTVQGNFSALVGGLANVSSFGSSVLGGVQNTASGFWSSIAGGELNTTTSGSKAVVVGGQSNTASGDHSVVSGGRDRSVGLAHDWRAGDLFEDD